MTALRPAEGTPGPVLAAVFEPKDAAALFLRSDRVPEHAVTLSDVNDRRIDERIRTDVSCWWNDRCFSILFRGRFTELRIAPPETAPQKRTPRLWEQSDVFECFFRAEKGPSHRYFELQAAPDGRWIDASVRRDRNDVISDFTWDSRAVVSSSIDRTTNEWRSVLTVPWTHLALPPAPGALFRANFFRASGRYHGEELLSWTPLGDFSPRFHQPEAFGTVLLL